MRTLAAMAIVISALTVQGPTVLPKDKPADSITREELRDHVYFLASDFLGGRRPDDAGYNIAAEYAASQFRSAGVRPAFTAADGTQTYFQKVPLMKVTTTKVDFEKVQRLSQLIYEVTAELGNRDKSIRPAVSPKGE